MQRGQDGEGPTLDVPPAAWAAFVHATTGPLV
nr:DUF397 domain-containing protein [Streptomyces albidoflavus]